jgi:hypothetical protein
MPGETFVGFGIQSLFWLFVWSLLEMVRPLDQRTAGGVGMKYRIFIWAGAGFLVAGFWALFALATFPSTNERLRDVWSLVCLTCPIAIAGRHYPISLYEVLAANTVMYALVGLIAETLRRQLKHAS